MYHGPVEGALPFFEELGFVCPLRKDPASFLQEVSSAKGGFMLEAFHSACSQAPHGFPSKSSFNLILGLPGSLCTPCLYAPCPP